ncbi:MAG: (Fe-S)-binding protein [Limnobacter sp.]|nr:(Fe-S)-binding protein [Limnobacter sp.]
MKVGLFVTCLVDALRPSIGLSALELLESAGFEVEVPQSQTCCGQPAWNSGDAKSTRKLAIKWLAEFEAFDFVVIPSGSCASMVVKHYQEVFAKDKALQSRAKALADKTFELTDFLIKKVPAEQRKLAPRACVQTVTYHDSCSGLRDLNIQSQPRQLMSEQNCTTLKEMKDSRQCCGFGGTFSIKYGEVSTAICDDKCQQSIETGAQAVVLGDLGCMLNIEGRLQRVGSPLKVLHISELLTGRGPGQVETPSSRLSGSK